MHIVDFSHYVSSLSEAQTRFELFVCCDFSLGLVVICYGFTTFVRRSLSYWAIMAVANYWVSEFLH